MNTVTDDGVDYFARKDKGERLIRAIKNYVVGRAKNPWANLWGCCVSDGAESRLEANQLASERQPPKSAPRIYPEPCTCHEVYDLSCPQYRDIYYHGAPRCRCGARNTARIGESALTRQCQACGQTYAYRLKDGILVPHSLETAMALDGR